MSNNGAITWYALDLHTEPEAREAVEYALMEAGALGTETSDAIDGLQRISAYFQSLPHRQTVRTELAEALRIYELPSSAVRDMQMREVANRDWLVEWKQSWQPVTAGRFIIAPPWSELGPHEKQIVIRIEPGMAFGTGTHETTRLCLKAIEMYFDGGSFLDVGTGTGILAIAAAMMFPEARVEACDVDADAIEIARENARINNVSKIDFRVGSIGTEPSSSADLVCANLTADVIVDLLPTFIATTCGRLVLSGILDSQIDMVTQKIREHHAVANFTLMRDGEWIAIIV